MREKLIRPFLVLPLLFCTLAGQDLVRERSDDGDIAKLRVAATQHEIIAIRLQEGLFEQAVNEYQKLLELNLEGENETLLVKEAWQVASQLLRAGRHKLAQVVIDGTLGEVELKQNEFSLLMLKGKVLKDSGRLREAINVYRQAQKLQK